MNKKAFTLLEIIVSSVILSLVAAGFISIFYLSKRFIQHSRSRTVASQLGKIFLDPLQADVRQDQWVVNSNCLTSCGSICSSSCPGQQQISNITYTPEYQIEPVPETLTAPDPLGLRKVKLTINWVEPSP